MKSADSYQHLVGKILIESGQEANVQKTDEHVFESDLPEKRRIVKPGYKYTCDHVEDRLRVKIDENGVIKLVRYG